jgi:sec-independent protein translocase protein TatA
MPELFAPGHLIPLLIVAAILFFGWKQLPDMARSVGKSLRIFKTEMKGMSDDDKVRDANKATEPKAIEQKAEPAPASDAVRPETSKPSAE